MATVERAAAPAPAAGLNHALRLEDGRRLGFAEYGAPSGAPVFFFHGSLESRLGVHPDADARAAVAGVRLIAPDRPGFGLSDFQPGRRLLDWPRDVEALANHLGVDRYAIIGWSGGAPHAFACGARSERVTRIETIGSPMPADWPGALDGMAPYLRRSLRLAGALPFWMVALGTRQQFGRGRDHPGEVYAKLFTSATAAADLAIVHRPEVRRMLLDTFAEAFRQGTRGAAWEARILARPWGFEPSEVRASVRLWHGISDDSVGSDSAAALRAELPRAEARVLPMEGHFLLIDHLDEVLAACAAAAR